MLIWVLTGFVLGLSSCEKAPELTLTGPTSFELSADGGSATINFTANRDWRVSCSETWISVSPSSGKAASGTVAVTVKQSANTGVLVPKTSYEITSEAQTIEVEVQKNINYTVEIEESCKSWIKKVGTKALTSEKISFEITENTSYDARKGTITIIPFTGSEQTIVVNQAAKAAINISPDVFDLSYTGGQIEVNVKANVDFDVKPNVEWIHYVETKALHEQTVVLKIDKKETNGPREGTVTISQKNGSLSAEIKVNQFAPPPTGAVDLGIVMIRKDGSKYPLYWATCNLGATKPEEYGDYFAWGETSTKTEYTWGTYKWANGAYNKLIKYCPSDQATYWDGEGVPDNLLMLDSSDDAALALWGNHWRIPSFEEWTELCNKCIWTWTTLNGIKGCIVESSINGNSIFLPAAGDYSDYAGKFGYYWSSSLSASCPYYAFFVYFGADSVGRIDRERYLGISIRPVAEE